VLASTDAMYATYAASFYMDVSALLFLLGTVAAALLRSPVLFAITGALFAASKAQHVFAASIFVLLAVYLGLSERGVRRASWFMASGFIAFGVVWCLMKMPPGYGTTNLYNSVFYRLIPQAASVPNALAELGLEPGEARYAGVHAFQPEAPLYKAEWRNRFVRSSGYGKLLRYYALHPRELLGRLWLTLQFDAADVRQHNLGNYRRETNMPPYSKDYRVAVWSNARDALIERWPTHLILVYLAAPLAAWMLRNSWPESTPVILALTVVGAVEFGVAAFADGVETSRQLIVFQGITDMLICGFAAGLAARLIRDR
jgi:hypothetical protein